MERLACRRVEVDVPSVVSRMNGEEQMATIAQQEKRSVREYVGTLVSQREWISGSAGEPETRDCVGIERSVRDARPADERPHQGEWDYGPCDRSHISSVGDQRASLRAPVGCPRRQGHSRAWHASTELRYARLPLFPGGGMSERTTFDLEPD